MNLYTHMKSLARILFLFCENKQNVRVNFDIFTTIPKTYSPRDEEKESLRKY